jgi:hypothetical protein
MKSRVHPTYKTQYRVGNWREYDCALVRRGDITLWLSPNAMAAWRALPSGRPGGQQRFSDLEIETALMLRLVFHLPLRQTEGFVRSILTVMRAGLDAPDHTTLSRRSQWLDVAVHNLPATAPLHLIVDSTGLSVVGEGEWAAAKHGGRGTRAWKKLHLGVDRAGVILAHALTAATIAFTRFLDDEYDLYTVKPDGTDVRRLTNARGNDAHSAWSPDGDWLAFSSARGGFKDEKALHPGNAQPYGDIYVVRADGSDVRQLTDTPFEEGTVAWAPARRPPVAKATQAK